MLVTDGDGEVCLERVCCKYGGSVRENEAWISGQTQGFEESP
jgi:hypothetical protein